MIRPLHSAQAAQVRSMLPWLLAEVVRARESEEVLTRTTPFGRNALALGRARNATLAALLDYAEAIEALAWPVPRSVQMEIRMHRIVCDPRRPRYGY